MPTVSVLIPSTLKPSCKFPDRLFVERGIETIRAQTANVEIQIIVGLDPGATAPAGLDAQVAFAKRPMLSAAVNAASEQIDGDYVALLEDDDEWCPNHLAESLDALASFDFVSGNQLVVDPADRVIHINDFPIPLTWVMPRYVWKAVGGFSEEYPVHQDNEWLGRLSLLGVNRTHLVEATAPENLEDASELRPWLAFLLSRPNICLRRHSSPYPLTRRLQHPASWMGRIRERGPEVDVSRDCYRRLINTFGALPW